MRKLLMSIMALGLSVVLVACGGKSEGQEDNDAQEIETVEFTEEETVSNDQVVATINGNEIKGEEYNLIYAQTKVRLHQYRQDISDLDMLKEQTLNILIDQELLRQDAERAGIEVSAEEVEGQFDEAKEEISEEQFTAFLDQYRLTEEEFKNQLYFSIMHDKYLELEIPEAEISDEEVKEVYEELKEQNEEFPDFEEVEERLKQELAMQQEQEELQDRINELRDEAEIDKII